MQRTTTILPSPDEVIEKFNSHFNVPIIEFVNNYLQNGTQEGERACWNRLRGLTHEEYQELIPWLRNRFFSPNTICKNGKPFPGPEQPSEEKSEFTYAVRNWLFLAKLYKFKSTILETSFIKSLRIVTNDYECWTSINAKDAENIRASLDCFHQAFALCDKSKLSAFLLDDYLDFYPGRYHQYIFTESQTALHQTYLKQVAEILELLRNIAKDEQRTDSWYAIKCYSGNPRLGIKKGVEQHDAVALLLSALQAEFELKSNVDLDSGGLDRDGLDPGAHILYAEAAKLGLMDALEELAAKNGAHIYITTAIKRRCPAALYGRGRAYGGRANPQGHDSAKWIEYYAMNCIDAYFDAASVGHARSALIELNGILFATDSKAKIETTLQRRAQDNFQWAPQLGTMERALIVCHIAQWPVPYEPPILNQKMYFMQLVKKQPDVMHLITDSMHYELVASCFPAEYKKAADAFIDDKVKPFKKRYKYLNKYLPVLDVAKLVLEYQGQLHPSYNALICVKEKPAWWMFWKQPKLDESKEDIHTAAHQLSLVKK